METGHETDDRNPAGSSFQLVPEPVVQSREPVAEEELPATYGVDLLCAIARDPNVLFVYWDVNWPRLFEGAGVSQRPVHLRVYRGDGEVESTFQINPFRGHCYVDIAMTDCTYTCELGCFQKTEWKGLVRSGETMTPRAALSDDLSTTFATLPLHLSFERLLDIFRERQAGRETLAFSVAELQKSAREMETEPATQASSDAAALIASAPPIPAISPSEEERAKWAEVTRRLLAETNLGGSSRG
jgi:hypothetical protein